MLVVGACNDATLGLSALPSLVIVLLPWGLIDSPSQDFHKLRCGVSDHRCYTPYDFHTG